MGQKPSPGIFPRQAATPRISLPWHSLCNGQARPQRKNLLRRGCRRSRDLPGRSVLRPPPSLPAGTVETAISDRAAVVRKDGNLGLEPSASADGYVGVVEAELTAPS